MFSEYAIGSQFVRQLEGFSLLRREVRVAAWQTNCRISEALETPGLREPFLWGRGKEAHRGKTGQN